MALAPEFMAASTTFTRSLTAALLVPIVVAIVWWGPLWLLAVATALVMVGALSEFFELGKRLGAQSLLTWTAGVCVLVVAMQWSTAQGIGGHNPLPQLGYVDVTGILCVFVVGLCISVVLSRRSMKERMLGLAISASAFLMIGWPFSYLVALAGPDPHVIVYGTHSRWDRPVLLLFVLIVVWVGDTAAYFVGRSFGVHKLAPAISPGKTWEGALGNLLGSVLGGWLFAYVTDAPVRLMLGAAVVASIAGQVGDLLESVYKRAAEVKDSGTLLPGHGGVLDRIDALIFAAPAVWVYFTHVVR
jgi:phosphatidate cytidylyltransferase